MPRPGFAHFPQNLDEDCFLQLTAERVLNRFERSHPLRSRRPKRDGECNKFLDTFAYARTLLHGLISMRLRLNDEADSFAAMAGEASRKGLSGSGVPAIIKS
nr:terminase gpA endonuclease subunit [Yoonia sp.]